ncbi:MAG: hypothetical protein FJW31_19055 [Acidobacteria bacterium]|nr:hypothetical protein [Acidobacteriota bacterium]
MPSLRQTVWRVWVAAGLGFTAWLIIGFQAAGVAPELLKSSATARVVHGELNTTFVPQSGTMRSGLVFLPGGLVDPEVYVRLARTIAEAGHPLRLNYLPMRSAFTEK